MIHIFSIPSTERERGGRCEGVGKKVSDATPTRRARERAGERRKEAGRVRVRVSPCVAWPHILRSSQGGSGEGRRMGTNTVLSCSQLITFPPVPSHLSRPAFAGKKRSSLKDTRGPFPGTPGKPRPAPYPLHFAPRAARSWLSRKKFRERERLPAFGWRE